MPDDYTINPMTGRVDVVGPTSADDILPSQTGNSGKYLTTNGTNSSWATITSGAAWGSITGTLSAQTDLQTALDALLPLAGGTLTGPLSIQGSGTIQTWLTSGGDPLGHVDTTLGSLVIPYSAPAGNLYLGQTQIGNGGINYTYDSSVTSPYVAHDFLRVWNGYNQTVVASIDASGNATFGSISAPSYFTGDNGSVVVAMGFFSGLPGLYIHDTNGTSADYMRFVKNNGTYIVQTTWDGQTTFGAYASSAVALIARGYSSSTADIFQVQQWGGISGASGTVLAKFDYLGNLTAPSFNGITLSGSSTPALTVTGTTSVSGTNTGDQTITLTGGVTGSGTGSFAATVITNANLTGPITSSGNATSVASQTGTGSKFVMDTSPTITTASLAAATMTGALTISAQNIVTDTTTGTMIATSSTQKLGFFGTTPGSKGGAATDPIVVLSNLGLRASGAAWPLTTTGNVNFGNVTLGTAGNKLSITTGSNASAGTGTLIAGTVTISTTAVTANSLIFLQDTASSIANVGTLTVSSKTAGSGFVVTSTLALDTSTFNWLIIN